MPADIIQAKYDDLARLKKSFDSQSETADTLLRQITHGVDQLHGRGWTGPGAERFCADMDDSVIPALRRLKQAFTRASVCTQDLIELFRRAEEEARQCLDTGASPFMLKGPGGTGFRLLTSDMTQGGDWRATLGTLFQSSSQGKLPPGAANELWKRLLENQNISQESVHRLVDKAEAWNNGPYNPYLSALWSLALADTGQWNLKKNNYDFQRLTGMTYYHKDGKTNCAMLASTVMSLAGLPQTSEWRRRNGLNDAVPYDGSQAWRVVDGYTDLDLNGDKIIDIYNAPGLLPSLKNRPDVSLSSYHNSPSSSLDPGDLVFSNYHGGQYNHVAVIVGWGAPTDPVSRPGQPFAGDPFYMTYDDARTEGNIANPVPWVVEHHCDEGHYYPHPLSSTELSGNVLYADIEPKP